MMKRQRYTDEFKLEAVRLMVMDGQSAPEVSKQLGVSPGLLYKWKKTHLQDLGEAARKENELSPAEMAAEIDQLRKKLAKSERINEILKKTVGYFARDEQ